MEIADVFANVPKEKFKNAANKLLGECFILRKHKETSSDYYFILNNQAAFKEYFDLLDYELIIEEKEGVICLYNASGSGRIRLKLVESILLLLIRMLYIEKRKQLSLSEDVIVLAEEIYDKYAMMKMNTKMTRTMMRNVLGMFQRYHLIQKLDADMSNPDTRIIIYPSILFAMTSGSLDEMYELAKDRLEKYAIGSEENGTHETEDNEEETDED